MKERSIEDGGSGNQNLLDLVDQEGLGKSLDNHDVLYREMNAHTKPIHFLME